MTLIAKAYAGGWLAVATHEGEPEIRMRVAARADGRLRIVELWITSDEGLTGTSLRDLPLGQWEAVVNQERFAAALRERLAAPSGEGERALEQGRAELLPPSTTGRPDDDAILGSVRLTATAGWEIRPPLKLEIPAGRRRPDEFYRQAAEAYSWLAGRSRRPAAELAKANNVPETTVHRWIKEARRRRLLGPSRLRKDGAED